MNIQSYIRNGYLKIIAKPNSRESKIIGYDAEKQALRVSIAAPAEDNKANMEVVKFFSKLLKKKVRIKTGLRSKEKLLEII